MPKQGFNSITTRETIYDKFNEFFEAHKAELRMKGINSLSGFMVVCLQEAISSSPITAIHARTIEVIEIIKTKIILEDRRYKRIVELELQGKDRVLFCYFCRSFKCSHVGFCCSLAEIYPFKLGEEVQRTH